MKKGAILVLGLAFVLGAIFFSRLSRQSSKEPPDSSIDPPSLVEASQRPAAEFKTIRALAVAGAPKAFQFSARVPVSFELEAVTEINSINVFDPASSEPTNLEKSQIFIRFFRADSFQTLSTVTIHNQTNLIINDRPAVRYEIEKRPSVGNFPNQPVWRNERHVVTDIRVSDQNPSIFYVIAQRPDLPDRIYQEFLESLRVVASQAMIAPIDDFRNRITKKPFGIEIDPSTSPVQPERFSGFHTGVDVEYDDRPTDVPVFAVADGRVFHSAAVSGYGGLIVIDHKVDNRSMLALYGHLKPASLLKKDASVLQGDRIGLLGQGFTQETDGERKHLHFGILAGQTVDLRGYVAKKSELSLFRNPLELIN